MSRALPPHATIERPCCVNIHSSPRSPTKSYAVYDAWRDSAKMSGTVQGPKYRKEHKVMPGKGKQRSA